MEEQNGIGIKVGPLAFRLAHDRVHSLAWHGVEFLRAVYAPVRDADWGTIPEATADLEITVSDDEARLVRHFVTGPDLAEGRLEIIARAEGRLSVAWTLTAHADLSVNRAGLCLLHPLVGVEGEPLTVTEDTGNTVSTTFPAVIAPSQPATSIAGLRHNVFSVEVNISFEGEVFEMEDQRNWSDASYKTYCRPLSAPRPVSIKAGDMLAQKVMIALSGSPQTRSSAHARRDEAGRLPEILLAVEPGWMPQKDTARDGLPRLARFADDLPWSDGDIARLAETSFDAEIVLPEGADPHRALSTWKARFDAEGLAPRHVIALPAPYLVSHQPDGPWPEGTTPADCAIAARDVFPEARVGVGMLTNFTEFNRCPPPDGIGDYITHGNSAIVHAADDLSVLQTLEAIPSIFDSARRLGCDRPYRIGLCSIGMRTNPYGSGLKDNGAGKKITMTATDPRQGTDFAAAYAIGLTTLAALSGAEAICLGAPDGPFSTTGPLAATLRVMSRLQGQTVALCAEAGHFEIAGPDLTLIANCTLESWTDARGGPLGPASWRALLNGSRGS